MSNEDDGNVIGVNFRYNNVKPLIDEHGLQFEKDLIEALETAIKNDVSYAVIITFLQLYLFRVTQDLSEYDEE